MLYLTRKVGESVVINDTIEVTVVEVRGKSIKLGFTFPPEVSVLRREIHERIMEENKAAAGGGGLPSEDLAAAAVGNAAEVKATEAKPAESQAGAPKRALAKPASKG